MLRPPDILFLAVTFIFVVGLVVWLGQMTWESDGWRPFLFAGIPLIHSLTVVFWWTSRQKLRRLGYKWYYRFFGPRCTVRITGRFEVNANRSDDALLNEVYLLTKNWNPRAKVDINVNNRSVIRAGAQTLTTTVVTNSLEESDDRDDLEDEDGAGVEKSVSFDLGGYEGAIASLDDALYRRALPLLLRLNSDIKKQGTDANLSLQAHIDGTNPFLTLYLRDIPSSRVEAFHLKLTTENQGLREMVEVTADTITVAARTPDALVESARGYLSSPALAHRS